MAVKSIHACALRIELLTIHLSAERPSTYRGRVEVWTTAAKLWIFSYAPPAIELTVWLAETINATATTISENRYEGVIGPEGRSSVRRRTIDIEKKTARSAHVGNTVLLILIILSNTILSATKPSLDSLINPSRVSFWT